MLSEVVMPAILKSVDVLVERGVVENKRMAYHAAQYWFPAGVVVKLGERTFINEAKLDAYIAAGGALGRERPASEGR
jgi:hypothetical protein